MVEKPELAENEAGTGEIRSKLVARLAVAGVLVGLLLGVLAFFDYLATAPDESDEQVFTKPVPVAPKKEISQPVTPAESPSVSPVPEKIAAPLEPPPPPKIEAKPEVLVEPRPKQSSPATAAKTPAPASAPHATVPEATTAPSNILPLQRAPAPVERITAKPAVSAVEARPAPVVSRLFSGFLLQAGVFSSVQRAEELHARLTLSGVQSTLETRVQVGPFKTKQEAEMAQAKLKELGVETILVPPKGKN
jgi:DedD protein